MKTTITRKKTALRDILIVSCVVCVYIFIMASVHVATTAYKNRTKQADTTSKPAHLINEDRLQQLIAKHAAEAGFLPTQQTKQECYSARAVVDQVKKGEHIDVASIRDSSGYESVAVSATTDITDVEEIVKRWTTSDTTKAYYQTQYTHACIECSDAVCVHFMVNRFPEQLKENTTTSNTQFQPTSGLISCNVHQDCGGGTRLLTQDACNNSTCCQIGPDWKFYENKAQCITDQNAYYAEKERNIQRILDTNQQQYPTLRPINTLAPFPTFAPVTIAPVYSAEQCRADVQDKYASLIRNCSIQYGATSAQEMCIYAQEKERDKELAACGG